MCKQVAKWIRYYQTTHQNGRWRQADVQDALAVRLAHIAGGGYDESGRVLPTSTRLAVFERDHGLCQRCARPANEVDHIDGSSSELSNLQLLCRDCHMEKTKDSWVLASAELVESVHHAIRDRALERPRRQPCDSTEWDFHSWSAPDVVVPQDEFRQWMQWAFTSDLPRLTPAIAVAGFPPHLDGWAWYPGELRETSTAAPSRLRPSRSPKQQVEDFYASLKVEKVARRERRQFQPVKNGLPYYPLVSGSGKRHISWADLPASSVPGWIADPKTSPVCGTPNVTLDVAAAPLTPIVGEPTLQYIDNLCGRCMDIQESRASQP